MQDILQIEIEDAITSDACIFVAADEDMECLYVYPSSLSLSSESQDTCSRSLDFSDDDSSIQKHVEKLHELFTNQDLHMANIDIDALQTELKRQRVRVQDFQHMLKEKEDSISKFKLERDLADAERKLLRQQFVHLLDVEEGKGGCIDVGAGEDEGRFQHVVVHQFHPGYPCNEWKDWTGDCNSNDDGIAKRLLDGWKSQEDLHRIILKSLSASGAPPFIPEQDLHQSKPSCKHLALWKPVIIILEKMRLGCVKGKRSQSRVIKFFSIKRRLRSVKHKMKYQAMHDDNDTIFSDDEAIEGIQIILKNVAQYDAGIDTTDTNLKLIDEIVSFDEKNRKCANDAHQHMCHQAKRIRSLEREVQRLESLYLGAYSSTRTEASDDTDQFSLDCQESDLFSGICGSLDDENEDVRSTNDDPIL
jgi:hypothetical protein